MGAGRCRVMLILSERGGARVKLAAESGGLSGIASAVVKMWKTRLRARVDVFRVIMFA